MNDTEITLTVKLTVAAGQMSAAELEEAAHRALISAARKHHLQMQVMAREALHTEVPGITDRAQFEADLETTRAFHALWADAIAEGEVDVLLRTVA